MSDPYHGDAHHVTVNVGWALLGKHPGTDRDYSILASSAEPLSEPEFASVMRHFMPGTPPTERERPDSLPWVTISRVRVDEQVYVGIAIMDRDPDGQVDMGRRPITRTSYFCVRYLESSADKISYYGLYQALAGIELPYPNNDLIRISVPLLDPEGAARDIRSFGEPLVRAAAARLLGGPVSILGAEQTKLEDRLRFLDAVAALLPYGYRTSFSAATWSDSGARHPIRLAFATRPRQDAGVVKWRSEPGAATGVSEEYAGLIQQVLYRSEDEQLVDRPDPLMALVGYLADDTEPHGFDQPTQACARVRDFGLPFIVWDEVRAGTWKITDVRTVFRKHRITELPWAGRRALLVRLFFSGEQDDWALIREWRVTAVGDDPAVLLSILIETCYGQIWTSSPSMASKVSEYLRLAYEERLLDDLLARLAEAPAIRAELMGGLRAAAQAIADGLALVPDLATCRRTWAALAKNPLIACELLTHLASSEPLSVNTVSWLMSTDHVLLTPFSAVFARAGAEVHPSDIERLAEYDEECVRALMDAAARLGHLDRALPAFAAWLWRATAASGERHRGAARDWGRYAADLDRHTVTSKAWVDLVLLICRSPGLLREQQDMRSWKPYNERLVHAWDSLANYLDPAFDETMTDTLADYLETDRAAAVGQFSGVEDLVDRLTAGDRRRRLRDSLEEIRPSAGRRRRSAQGARNQEETQEEVLPREQVTRQWEAPQREQSPRKEDALRAQEPERGVRAHAGADEILITLSRLQPGARITDVTGPCTEALDKQVDPQKAGRALADSGAIVSGELAAQMIRRLRNQLGTNPGMNAPHAEEWLYSLATCFADGTIVGSQFALDFTEIDTRQKIDDINLNLRWLQGTPSDQLRQILQDLEDKITTLRKSLPSRDGAPGDPAAHKRKISDFMPWGNQEKKAKGQEGETG